ncbi:ABC transporter ATP-binding protein [Rhizobium puerariae]|uniref:ABC transporter ATP-binding protein n=1 Tax=Rhizobium puerariae TaxID=1585791 RepID=A0ABV6AJ90_9HYPH
MLEIRNLKGGYGSIDVLRGIDITVAKGEFVGILGHNGMGKSTLLKTIIGHLPAAGGTMTFEGRSIAALPPPARVHLGIGYVPQGRRIFPQLTVRENLTVAARATRRPAAIVDEIIAELPALERLSSRKGGALSGGEQQILALGRCLCTQPRLLLLDEPTEGVQPSIVEQMAATLARLHVSLGLSTILVEQNLDFIRALADRIAVLERGRITSEMSRAEAHDAHRLSALMGFATPSP